MYSRPIRMNNRWEDMATCPVPDDGKSRFVLVWHIYQTCMVYDCIKARKNRFVVCWMEIPESWIPIRSRQPTHRDANRLGVVIVKDAHGDVRLRGWRNVSSEEGLTHWMPTPDAPVNLKQLRDQVTDA